MGAEPGAFDAGLVIVGEAAVSLFNEGGRRIASTALNGGV